MKNSTRIITALALIATLCSCSLFKTAQKDEAPVAAKETDRELWTENTTRTVATSVRYEIDLDTLTGNGYTFELPESMNADIDSLLNSWQARNMLHKFDGEGAESEPVQITDTMYAKRLAALPTIVRMPYNNMVRACIDRYTKKGRSQVSYLLGISEYYFPIIEEEIDRIGVPRELKYLPIIESALNPKAASRAGAKGLWQFMFHTGKLYGLKANNYIDERFDPVKATSAALHYLKDLYDMFQNWELAIAAYNCGPGNVKKAIRRSGGSRAFWDIYPFLPRETRGYVPSFIAALYMLEYYKEHNMQPAQLNMPAHIDTFKVHKNLHFEQISAVVGVPMDDLKNYNPQYIEHIIPGNSGEQILKLPYNYTNAFIEKEKEVYTYKDSIYFNPITKESIKKNASLSSGGNITHVVKRGETLGHIAMKYRVSVKNLMRWNGLTSKSVLRIGQRLKINGGTAPAVKSSGGGSKSSGGSAATSKSGGYEWYTIKKGDTLLGIAYKFSGVSLNDILRLNGLNKNSKIYPGRKIKIRKL